MLRITGGILGGRLIRVPGGPVRPTQERVREALFSMLGERVVGCRFLELFAGSGAVGIEAWSRGAAFVCWVERHPRVLSVLERNVRELCDGRTQILRWDAEQLLKKGLEAPPFDIIFADPPYQRKCYQAGRGERSQQGEEWERRLTRLIETGPILAPDGLLILERAARELVQPQNGWRAVNEKVYGDTRLRILRRES